MTSNGRENAGRPSKIQRLIENYDLQGIGEEMEHLWTAENSEERKSLRDLATHVNQELLRQALGESDIATLEGEVENIYRLLTDDEVSSADRTRAQRRLEREGIDVEQLRSDFVTYQSVRRYLKTHRNVEYTKEEAHRTEKTLNSVQRLRSRLLTVVENRLESLHTAEEISLGEFRVFIDLRIVCEDCGTRKNFTTLLQEGGCECSQPG